MKKYISIFLLIAILFTLPIATAQADDDNSAGLYVYGVTPRMIEPWGVTFALKATNDSEISLADDYGIIVMSSEDYGKAESTDVENLLEHTGATLFHKEDITFTNGYYSVSYANDFYTYQIDEKITIIPFIHINEEYLSGKLYTTSTLDVIETALTNPNIPSEVNLVFNDIKDLFNITSICYEEDGITSVSDADMSAVRRGNPDLESQGVTALVDLDGKSVNLGSTPRTCEPWGITFVTAYENQASLYDFGTIVIDTSALGDKDYTEALFSPDAYIFSHRDGTLKVNEKTGLCYSKLEGVVKTYELDKEFLCIPYVMSEEDTYLIQLNYVNSSVSRTTLEGTITRAIDSGILSKNKVQLLDAMKRYYNDLKIARNIDISSAPLSYTVTFSAGDVVTTVPETQYKFWGLPLVLSEHIPTRNDYIFLGWSTSANSNDVSYICGEKYFENADVELFAVWAKDDDDYGGGVVKP